MSWIVGGGVHLSAQIKPISYFKANAAEIIDRMNDDDPPIVITCNGEAAAVLQSVAEYDRTQDELARLLDLLGTRRSLAESA